MAQVRVVLVRPQTAANLGAVARVIRNTGLAGLDLVQPGDWRTVECWRTAWAAEDVLEQARVFAGLAEAIAGSACTIGFSGRRGPAVLDVREAAAQVAALDAGATAALVFGPETSGLTLAELALCGRRASIPSHPAQPSLNLSHAVMVACYEVFRAGGGPSPTPPRLATSGEKQAVLGLLLQGLRAIGALTGGNQDGYSRQWETLIQRADLTPKEVRLLEHMARKMAKVRP